MATEKKITKKDNFIEIVNVLEAAGRTDLADVMKHEIELMENKASKAKATAAKKKSDGDALTAAVEAVLTDELTTIANITAKVEFDDEVTISRVQYRLNQLEKNGKARKEQIIVGGDGAKRKVMAFALPIDVDIDED